MAENKEDKSSAKKGKKKVDIVKEVKKSPWVFSTVILVVLILIVLAGNFGNCVTGKTISAEEAGSRIEQFASSNGDEISVKGVEEEAGLYKVLLDVQGQETSVFVTKDGENLIPTGAVQSLELEEDSQENEDDSQDESDKQQEQNISKSDKPEVELFIMSYCPYGTQAQKGMLPAVQALEDNVDFDMRYVNYLMHGEKEGDENTVQYCIDEEQEDKYMDYMTCFLDSGESEPCLDEADIDKDKLQSCVEETDKEYNITSLIDDKSSYKGGQYPQYNVHKDSNEEYGVRGSPTLVINGVKLDAKDTNGDGRGDTFLVNGESIPFSRDPATYLNLICTAFAEDSKPDVCEENDLSTETYSTMFGYDVSSSSNSNDKC